MLDLILALSVLIIMMLVIGLGVITFLSLIGPLFKGAPFVPTNRRAIQTMVDMVKPHSGDKVVDLGSGDGRILFAFASRGAHATGYELNPLLVWYTLWRARRKALMNQVQIYQHDFWKADLSPYTIVVIYGRWGMFKALQKKLKNECQKGTKVLSKDFDLPQLKLLQRKNSISMYCID